MKIKTGFHFVINYEVYPFDLLVSINEDWDTIEKFLKRKLPAELHSGIEEGHTVGRTTMYENQSTFIRINQSADPPADFLSTIQHEVFHAVDFLMERIGCELTRSSDEAYAYMIQHITRKIYEKILV